MKRTPSYGISLGRGRGIERVGKVVKLKASQVISYKEQPLIYNHPSYLGTTSFP
jgi:hypothetical protein